MVTVPVTPKPFFMKTITASPLTIGRLTVLFLLLFLASLQVSAAIGTPIKHGRAHLHRKGFFHSLLKPACTHHHAR